jgi:hypothetical protein
MKTTPGHGGAGPWSQQLGYEVGGFQDPGHSGYIKQDTNSKCKEK